MVYKCENCGWIGMDKQTRQIYCKSCRTHHPVCPVCPEEQEVKR